MADPTDDVPRIGEPGRARAPGGSVVGTDSLRTGTRRLFADGTAPLQEPIAEALNLMGGAGDRAEEEYRSSVERLSREGDEVFSSIGRLYESLEESMYMERWALVQLAKDLNGPASLPFLDRILAAPIPEERSRDPHSFTTVGEEVMIRTTAVEALARLGAEGNREALELLRRQTQHEQRSVRISATVSYVEVAGDRGREELRRLLPAEDQGFVDIRRVPPSEVLQPDPTEHLRQPGVERDPRPVPEPS